MDPKKRFVATVLDRYQAFPGTLHRVLRQDRRLAAALFERGVRLEIVEDAFVLTAVRRTFRSRPECLEPIRSLHYFVPLIQELLDEPPLPEYLDYLRHKLISTGTDRQA
jgi:hypothetical protein